jgi:hypothetical protein
VRAFPEFALVATIALLAGCMGPINSSMVLAPLLNPTHPHWLAEKGRSAPGPAEDRAIQFRAAEIIGI